eukprot:26909_1
MDGWNAVIDIDPSGANLYSRINWTCPVKIALGVTSPNINIHRDGHQLLHIVAARRELRIACASVVLFKSKRVDVQQKKAFGGMILFDDDKAHLTYSTKTMCGQGYQGSNCVFFFTSRPCEGCI